MVRCFRLTKRISSRQRGSTRRRGEATRAAVTLYELMAVVVILGILSYLIVPRFGDHAKNAKINACNVNRGNIDVQCQLWYRNKGVWPATNLSDIGSSSTYFPEGLPTCPVDASPYIFDATLLQITPHTH